jgi:spore photoproduct lyase
VWGNRDGILEAHLEFAEDHPNILMEFKTKSNNISYFLEHKIPDNVVCSWSLNPDIIIKNEEHFTASLNDRITAARNCANAGIKVAFHFHPMVWYKGWADDYGQIAARLMSDFDSSEVLFVSFGSITLIKPVIQKIRDLGNPTKTLQMDFVTDPHGKMTYPDAIKIEMFAKQYDAFNPWKDLVFFYLCMEKAIIWEKSLGYVYENNDIFEKEFGRQTMKKVNSTST